MVFFDHSFVHILVLAELVHATQSEIVLRSDPHVDHISIFVFLLFSEKLVRHVLLRVEAPRWVSSC